MRTIKKLHAYHNREARRLHRHPRPTNTASKKGRNLSRGFTRGGRK